MNRLILPFLILLTSMLLQHAMAGPVYKVVDEKTGKVIGYTDKPQQAATSQEQAVEPVKLPPLNTQPGIKREKIDPESESIAPPEEAFAGYQIANISSPADKATITPGEQQISVSLQLSPTLQPGHLVQFYYDNKPYGKPVASTSIQIGNLIRGEYTISATVLDAQGKQLAATPSIKVFVKRASILNRPTSPNPAPNTPATNAPN